MCELVERVPALLRGHSRVGGAAGDPHQDVATPRGCQRDNILDAPGFAREDEILLFRHLVMSARAPGELISSSALIRTVSVAYPRTSSAPEHGEGMENQRHTALVVGDAETACARSPSTAERLGSAHASGVDRIHVGEEQDLLRARSRERGLHDPVRPAPACRRIAR